MKPHDRQPEKIPAACFVESSLSLVYNAALCGSIRERTDMIKVLLKSGETITFDLGDEKKEFDLVARFHHGLDGSTVLNLKTNSRGAASRIKVSEIKNMQHLKAGADKAKAGGESAAAPEGSKFKTREEYEKWKAQKMRESRRKS